MSIISDIDIFYENCMLMSIKSSTNQEIIDRLPFWKYVKLQKSLNKYMEAEAKQNGANSSSGNEDMQNHMDSMKQNTSGMMNSMKNNMRMPSMKLK